MSSALDFLSGALLLIGIFFTLVGSVGILRLPDVLSRLHGASITDTLGAASILLGLAIAAGWSLLMGKILALVVMIMLLNPSASHALARAAIHGLRKPWLERESD